MSWRGSSTSSVLLHILLIVALMYRFTSTGDVTEKPQGAGGPGPAGGGGGGTRGSGGPKERVQFIQVAPPVPKPAAAKVVTPPPPVIPPLVQPTPLPQPELPKLSAPTMPLGSLGGVGSDGTAGSGPGTGGGVGTGVGTGSGSAAGPGTGGGAQQNYPPTPNELLIPPIPIPGSVVGKDILVEFDIDEKGRVVGLVFGSTADRSYDRRLEEALRNYKFKAGHRPDGTPIRMKYQMRIQF